MTTRLYYTDPMTRVFEATVLACEIADGRSEVVLDQTAFYPTSGGQPFDTGTLGAVRVTEVIDRDDDVIAHVASAPMTVGERVEGRIDWPRRFDHMQQHTGQHVLSAAFDRLHGVRTISFHLGVEASTIDLAREVTPAEIAAAEDAVNQVVWDDREVVVRFVSEEDAVRLPLRKASARTGPLRLVEVTDFDLSACGGTHVPRTGMIGMVAVTHWERFKGGTRVSFVCGGRALRSHVRLRDIAASAATLLSVPAAEVPSTIERLHMEARRVAKTVQQLQGELRGHRAAALRADAEMIHGLRVILTSDAGLNPAELKALAGAIVAEAGCVAVLVGDGQPAPVVVARSAGVAFDAGAWMKRAIDAFGGRGGGRPEHAQGGLSASPAQILALAREALGAVSAVSVAPVNNDAPKE